MNESFLVSPTEAFLIGLCQGEHLQVINGNPETLEQSVSTHKRRGSFVKIMRSRLAPFVPDLRGITTASYSDNERATKLIWHSFRDQPPVKVALLPGQDDAILVNSGADVKRISWSRERHGLLDQLMLLLFDHLTLSPEDRLFCLFAKEPHLHDLWNRPADEARPKLLGPIIDNSPDISRILLELVSHNGVEQLFKTGLPFGILLRLLDEFEEALPGPGGELYDEFFDMETVDDEYEWESLRGLPSTISKFAESMLDKALVRQSQFAASKLRQIKDHPPRFVKRWTSQTRTDTGTWVPAPDLYEECVFQALQESKHSQCAAFLAIGEILGALRDADLAAKEVDWGASTPRAFKVFKSDNSDRVRLILHQVERDLSEKTTPTLVPEDCVGRLGNAIECLTKRLWHNEFSTGYNGELPNVLHGKMQSPSDIERRFASLALTLYKCYRNPSSHDLDAFRCSLEEARFFVASIRVMLDLYEHIVSDRK